jgi:hypothetical protein
MAKRAGGGRPSRMDLRRQAEAAEARGDEEETTGEAAEEEEAEEPEAEAEAEEGDGDEEAKPKKKKAAAKKKAPAVKKPAVKRTRTAKEVRMRATWVVFDNGSKVVDKFPFKDKAEAEALLAKKIAEKEGKAVFYINLVKEPLE